MTESVDWSEIYIVFGMTRQSLTKLFGLVKGIYEDAGRERMGENAAEKKSVAPFTWYGFSFVCDRLKLHSVWSSLIWRRRLWEVFLLDLGFGIDYNWNIRRCANPAIKTIDDLKTNGCETLSNCSMATIYFDRVFIGCKHAFRDEAHARI